MYSTIKKLIKDETILDSDQEQDIIASIQNGDDSKKDILLKKYMKFVLRMVRDEHESLDIEEELFQEAMIGFMKAIKNYDGSSKMSTYAKPYIKRAIQDYQLEFKRPIKMITTKPIRKIYYNLWKYTDEHGNVNNEMKERMAEELNVALFDIDLTLERLKVQTVVNTMNEDGDFMPISEILESEWNTITDFEEEREYEQKRSTVLRLMNDLNERQRDIIMERHLTDEPKQLSELSVKYGVSLQRIKQIEDGAINKLKMMV